MILDDKRPRAPFGTTGQQSQDRAERGGSSEKKGAPDPLRTRPGLSLVGLLLVEIIIGYEWFVSGLVKLVRGDFPAGLATEMSEKLAKAPVWYGRFLKAAVVPNAEFFGYLIEICEILAGVALIVGPLLWLFAWVRLSDRMRVTVLLAISVAAIGGAFLAINLHLFNAARHPWLIPESGFDEGIDLDSVLPAIQIVIAAVSIIFLKHTSLSRRRRR